MKQQKAKATDRMETLMVPISAIIAHESNYNTHPEEQLGQLGDSHEELGQFRSIVLWRQGPNLYKQVAGHGYTEGARQRGATELRAEVLPQDTPPEIIEAIMVADNLHAQNSRADEKKLAEILERLRATDMNLSAVGSSDEALDSLLTKLGDEMLSGIGPNFSPDDEEMVPISSESKGVEPVRTMYFGKYRIPLSDEEYEEMEQRVKQHNADTGGYFGFVRELLHL